ncbi:hypothetical protein V9T40_013730 [Parthenolecanium corni]|uniref:Cation/H+ exchanger transmembrane domain-containing protein n=1 Tax=Parthenolecanium corni TaxID=536013 RepID=A0AAN9TBQ2_9HEMI
MYNLVAVDEKNQNVCFETGSQEEEPPSDVNNGAENNHATAISFLTIAVEGLLIWGLLFTIFDQDAEPGGQLFSLILLSILSYISGWLITFLKMPPLLGMILCGVVLRNVGLFDVSGVYLKVVSFVRQFSLAIILIQAGLGLDPNALKKLSFVVARLAILPGLLETAATSVAAYFLLSMPYMWGLLLGCILSGVSPAVIIPSLLSLKSEGYGEDKGIATLIIAASTLDDIRSISMFGIILGMIFSNGGDLMQNILHGPTEIWVGILIGFIGGFLCACFPHRNEDYLVWKRALMVGGSGTLVILLSSKMGYAGSGPLAAIMIPLIASVCWKLQGWSKDYNPVSSIIHISWIAIQPLLFGLIGTEIRFEKIQLSLVWMGSLVVLAALWIRILTCCFILIGANLNWKELIFVNLAWLPKATVQATIGSIALDTVIQLQKWDAESLARNVLTISVLSILLTAPIGAIGITLCGPKMLAKKESENDITKKQKLEVFEDIRL